eukprot:9489410-Lingulodinium_polyedra.AAC.1
MGDIWPLATWPAHGGGAQTCNLRTAAAADIFAQRLRNAAQRRGRINRAQHPRTPRARQLSG